jgi:hypothetical protein
MAAGTSRPTREQLEFTARLEATTNGVELCSRLLRIAPHGRRINLIDQKQVSLAVD